MNEPIRLSVIIPAYNEEKRIRPTLEKIDAYLNRQDYESEVIVVDDHSKDGTLELITRFARSHRRFRIIENERNFGKGGSVRAGMLAAKGDYRLFSDADLSTPIEEVEKFLKLTHMYDVVIGSRRVKGANVAKRQPVHREASGRVFSVLVRLLTLRGFIDTQCGFKMFSAKAAQHVFRRQTIMRFGFDVEILYIAKKLGYKILEAPVTWYDHPATRVQLLRDSTHMFSDLIRIRWNDLKGAYSGAVDDN